MNATNLTIEEVQTLIQLNVKTQAAKRERFPLTDRLLAELINRAKHPWGIINPTLSDIINDVINYKHYCSACGCLGPMYGESYCGCQMNSLLETYKYEVVLSILFNRK